MSRYELNVPQIEGSGRLVQFLIAPAKFDHLVFEILMHERTHNLPCNVSANVLIIAFSFELSYRVFEHTKHLAMTTFVICTIQDKLLFIILDIFPFH